MEIDKCSSSNEKQRWVYDEPKSGRYRIKPKTRDDLCLERDGDEFRLKKCDGDSKQRFKGFKSSGCFELRPDGKDGLVSQAHDPKSHEILELIKKSTARGDHTNYWRVYNAESYGSSNKDDTSSSSSSSSSSDKSIDLISSDACTKSSPCGECQGDCDVSLLVFSAFDLYEYLP